MKQGFVRESCFQIFIAQITVFIAQTGDLSLIRRIYRSYNALYRSKAISLASLLAETDRRHLIDRIPIQQMQRQWNG
ncbi:hypothetical protein [Paenisporosarcina sp. NPDC076898]|uniref:hypothetical protein n=1 Tax=unclassified Paenisporosarcina TaxID=2642018 RepID=UPI003CFD6087